MNRKRSNGSDAPTPLPKSAAGKLLKSDDLAKVLIDLQQSWAIQASDVIAGNVLKALGLKASAGPGGNFGIVAYATPIDEQTTANFFWRVRKVSGWQRDT